ncbi:MAG: hypothetical protein M0D55_06110 [Elusimicrobiota bacterium]|nr:MAG: hypothetical protein M0D55_06110 [Elusimicrobiota bacterium]
MAALRQRAHARVLPGLTWEGSGLELSAGYAVSSAWYSSRASSGALSSWRVRAAWARWCRLKPWVGWARSREPFEVGSGRGVSNFAADHWSAGAEWRVSGGWAVDASFRRELRDGSAGRISHLGAGLSYSWGPL